MLDLRVLGIGSPFGDDQLGWQVVRLLQQSKVLKKYQQLEFICCDRPGMRLLELMQVANVFIVDAIKTGAPPGTIHCLHEAEFDLLAGTTSSHSFGIAQAFELGKVLNMLPKYLVFYGIEIGEISLEFKLSSAIDKQVKHLARQIEQAIIELYNRLG